MKERDWIHRKALKSNSSQHWNTYRKLRDKVNCLVKSVKMKYYCDLFQDAKGNAKKKVWNEVNEVCYRNSTSESVQCIISDEIQHTTPKSIASAMNSFFASIGKRLADKITTAKPSCNSKTDLPKSQLQLAELKESFVLQEHLTLKTNKAIGLDKISTSLLKNSAHTIALSVTKLLNLSNKTGKFPKLQKCFKVEPCLTQGTGQMHQTTDLCLFCLHSARFLRKLYIHSYTTSWLPINASQENSLDFGRDCPLYLL